MASLYYCWRCRADVMMLDDEEWALIEPLMPDAIQAIKDFRAENNATLAVTLAPNSGLRTRAQDEYLRITGVREPDPNRIYHHHLSHFGPPSACCGKLLRTPKATYCAECGADKE